jgi:hypothetical protein
VASAAILSRLERPAEAVWSIIRAPRVVAVV